MTTNPYRPGIQRHFWNSNEHKCDCGSSEKVWLCGHWVCLNRVLEELERQNIKLIKANNL